MCFTEKSDKGHAHLAAIILGDACESRGRVAHSREKPAGVAAQRQYIHTTINKLDWRTEWVEREREGRGPSPWRH